MRLCLKASKCLPTQSLCEVTDEVLEVTKAVLWGDSPFLAPRALELAFLRFNCSVCFLSLWITICGLHPKNLTWHRFIWQYFLFRRVWGQCPLRHLIIMRKDTLEAVTLQLLGKLDNILSGSPDLWHYGAAPRALRGSQNEHHKDIGSLTLILFCYSFQWEQMRLNSSECCPSLCRWRTKRRPLFPSVYSEIWRKAFSFWKALSRSSLVYETRAIPMWRNVFL